MSTGSKPLTYTRAGFQGDVAFVRVDAIPQGYAPVKPAGTLEGKPAHVAAHSETGHDHVIDASGVIMYEGPNPSIAYLRLAEVAEAQVTHLRSYDTHGTVTLTGGQGAVWKVVRQREWNGTAERRAAD